MEYMHSCREATRKCPDSKMAVTRHKKYRGVTVNDSCRTLEIQEGPSISLKCETRDLDRIPGFFMP